MAPGHLLLHLVMHHLSTPLHLKADRGTYRYMHCAPLFDLEHVYNRVGRTCVPVAFSMVRTRSRACSIWREAVWSRIWLRSRVARSMPVYMLYFRSLPCPCPCHTHSTPFFSLSPSHLHDMHEPTGPLLAQCRAHILTCNPPVYSNQVTLGPYYIRQPFAATMVVQGEFGL